MADHGDGAAMAVDSPAPAPGAAAAASSLLFALRDRVPVVLDAEAAATMQLLQRRRESTRQLPATALRLPPACRHRSQNLAYKLHLMRQCRSAPGAHGCNVRSLSAHLLPAATHFAPAAEPLVTARKFSPCGRYLVTFSRAPGVHAVVLFRFNLATRAAWVWLGPIYLKKNTVN